MTLRDLWVDFLDRASGFDRYIPIAMDPAPEAMWTGEPPAKSYAPSVYSHPDDDRFQRATLRKLRKAEASPELDHVQCATGLMIGKRMYS